MACTYVDATACDAGVNIYRDRDSEIVTEWKREEVR